MYNMKCIRLFGKKISQGDGGQNKNRESTSKVDARSNQYVNKKHVAKDSREHTSAPPPRKKELPKSARKNEVAGRSRPISANAERVSFGTPRGPSKQTQHATTANRHHQHLTSRQPPRHASGKSPSPAVPQQSILHKESHYAHTKLKLSKQAFDSENPLEPKLKFDMASSDSPGVSASHRVRFMSSSSFTSDPSQVHLMAGAASVGSSAMSSTADKSSRGNVFDKVLNQVMSEETDRLNAMGFGNPDPKSDATRTVNSINEHRLIASDTGLELEYDDSISAAYADKWQQMNTVGERQGRPQHIQDSTTSQDSLLTRSNSHDCTNVADDANWVSNWGTSTELPNGEKKKQGGRQQNDTHSDDMKEWVTLDINGTARREQRHPPIPAAKQSSVSPRGQPNLAAF